MELKHKPEQRGVIASYSMIFVLVMRLYMRWRLRRGFASHGVWSA